MRIFKAPDGAYQLSFPATWEKMNANEFLQLALKIPAEKDLEQPVMQITAEPLDGDKADLSLHELASAEEKKNKGADPSGPKIDLDKSEFITINGHEWWHLEYTLSFKQNRSKVSRYRTIRNRIYYTISYISVPELHNTYLEKVNTAVGTFRFLKPAGTAAGKPVASKPDESKAGVPTDTWMKEAIVPANVKTIDATTIKPFFAGFAEIKKGNLNGVIDRNGELIVPFGNYSFFHQEFEGPILPDHFFTFTDQKAKKMGFITKSGKVIYHNGLIPLSCFNREGKAIAVEEANSQNIYVIDSTGGKKLLRRMPLGWTYGASVSDYSLPYVEADQGNKMLRGYMDFSTGQYVIRPQFEGADQFSEGMAAIMKKDGFGKPQWGFINMKGIVVIQPKYSNLPEPFSNGLSLVKPADRSEIAGAYIDKTGKTRFTVFVKDFGTVGLKSFQGGYTTLLKNGREPFVADTLGNFYPLADFLKKFNITVPGGVKELAIVHHAGYMMYVEAMKLKEDFGTFALDLRSMTYQFIPGPSNDRVIEVFNYDDVSGLRHFKQQIRVKNNVTGHTEGYINRKSEFVMIKGKPAQW